MAPTLYKRVTATSAVQVEANKSWAAQGISTDTTLYFRDIGWWYQQGYTLVTDDADKDPTPPAVTALINAAPAAIMKVVKDCGSPIVVCFQRTLEDPPLHNTFGQHLLAQMNSFPELPMCAFVCNMESAVSGGHLAEDGPAGSDVEFSLLPDTDMDDANSYAAPPDAAVCCRTVALQRPCIAFVRCCARTCFL